MTQETINLVLTILSSGFFGIVVSLFYKLAFSRAVFSEKMQVSLIIYSMISAMMLYFDFYAGGVALLGAVTIMRFRSPVKDHRDIIFILLSVVCGFSCASHNFVLVGIGFLVLVVLTAAFGAFGVGNRIVLVVRGEASVEEKLINYVIDNDESFLKMLYNNSKDDSHTELIYRVKRRCKTPEEWCQQFKEKLYNVDGVDEVNVIFQQEDIGV